MNKLKKNEEIFSPVHRAAYSTVQSEKGEPCRPRSNFERKIIAFIWKHTISFEALMCGFFKTKNTLCLIHVNEDKWAVRLWSSGSAMALSGTPVACDPRCFAIELGAAFKSALEETWGLWEMCSICPFGKQCQRRSRCSVNSCGACGWETDSPRPPPRGPAPGPRAARLLKATGQ